MLCQFIWDIQRDFLNITQIYVGENAWGPDYKNIHEIKMWDTFLPLKMLNSQTEHEKCPCLYTVEMNTYFYKFIENNSLFLFKKLGNTIAVILVKKIYVKEIFTEDLQKY